MSTHFSEDDFNDLEPKEPTAVKDLPYYETLRRFLEPFKACDPKDADHPMASNEIIAELEKHHGVPQGPTQKGMVEKWVHPDDFVRAMRYLGYQEFNAGGGLLWAIRKK